MVKFSYKYMFIQKKTLWEISLHLGINTPLVLFMSPQNPRLR